MKQPGVVAISCAYSIYHHARPARARPPASSAAYQLFSSVHDLATAGLYGFGAAVVQRQGPGWTALIGGGGDGSKVLTSRFLVPAEQYALIGAGGLHLVSLAVGTYLALMFRRIARMPPDMNPLEDHLTRRAHKRNKSSVATTATWESLASSDGNGSSTGRISARLEQHRRSGAPYEDLARPPSIPFMHTRSGSRDSGVFTSDPGSPTTTTSTNRQTKMRAFLRSSSWTIEQHGSGGRLSAEVGATWSSLGHAMYAARRMRAHMLTAKVYLYSYLLLCD